MSNSLFWEKFNKVKFEICLLILCVFQFCSLCFIFVKAGSYKEIFLGLNIDLPFITQIVLGLNDFVVGWWFGVMPVTVIIVWFIVGTVYRMLLGIAEKDPRLQAIAAVALVIVFLVLRGAEAIADSAIMLPLMKLMNASI